MATKISMDARQELVRALSLRYRGASSAERRRILDEFTAVTGYHRKHSIRVLNAPLPCWSHGRPRRAGGGERGND